MPEMNKHMSLELGKLAAEPYPQSLLSGGSSPANPGVGAAWPGWQEPGRL